MRQSIFYKIRRLLTPFLLLFFLATPAFTEERHKHPMDVESSTVEVIFDSSKFQAGIRSDKALGALAKEHSAVGDKAVSFGFAEKSEEAKFFIMGLLYSEALAYLKSGKTDLSAKRLESLEKEFINLQVPSSLYNYISKTRNIIERKKYDPDVSREFLSLFQPLFEDYAKNKGEDKLILFRAGSWLFDMSLAAAAGNKELLRQPTKLNYFVKEMKRMDAPKGVLDSLDEIVKISEKKEITDKDTEQVLELAKKIQMILG